MYSHDVYGWGRSHRQIGMMEEGVISHIINFNQGSWKFMCEVLHLALYPAVVQTGGLPCWKDQMVQMDSGLNGTSSVPWHWNMLSYINKSIASKLREMILPYLVCIRLLLECCVHFSPTSTGRFLINCWGSLLSHSSSSVLARKSGRNWGQTLSSSAW